MSTHQPWLSREDTIPTDHVVWASTQSFSLLREPIEQAPPPRTRSPSPPGTVYLAETPDRFSSSGQSFHDSTRRRRTRPTRSTSSTTRMSAAAPASPDTRVDVEGLQWMIKRVTKSLSEGPEMKPPGLLSASTSRLADRTNNAGPSKPKPHTFPSTTTGKSTGIRASASLPDMSPKRPISVAPKLRAKVQPIDYGSMDIDVEPADSIPPQPESPSADISFDIPDSPSLSQSTSTASDSNSPNEPNMRSRSMIADVSMDSPTSLPRLRSRAKARHLTEPPPFHVPLPKSKARSASPVPLKPTTAKHRAQHGPTAAEALPLNSSQGRSHLGMKRPSATTLYGGAGVPLKKQGGFKVPWKAPSPAPCPEESTMEVEQTAVRMEEESQPIADPMKTLDAPKRQLPSKQRDADGDISLSSEFSLEIDGAELESVMAQYD